jgi:hypothetical protein
MNIIRFARFAFAQEIIGEANSLRRRKQKIQPGCPDHSEFIGGGDHAGST